MHNLQGSAQRLRSETPSPRAACDVRSWVTCEGDGAGRPARPNDRRRAGSPSPRFIRRRSLGLAAPRCTSSAVLSLRVAAKLRAFFSGKAQKGHQRSLRSRHQAGRPAGRVLSGCRACRARLLGNAIKAGDRRGGGPTRSAIVSRSPPPAASGVPSGAPSWSRGARAGEPRGPFSKRVDARRTQNPARAGARSCSGGWSWRGGACGRGRAAEGREGGEESRVAGGGRVQVNLSQAGLVERDQEQPTCTTHAMLIAVRGSTGHCHVEVACGVVGVCGEVGTGEAIAVVARLRALEGSAPEGAPALAISQPVTKSLDHQHQPKRPVSFKPVVYKPVRLECGQLG